MTDIFAWTTGDPSPVLQCIVPAGNADRIHSQRRTNLWGPHTMELVLLSKGCTWDSQRHLRSSKTAHPAWCRDLSVHGQAVAALAVGPAGTAEPWPALLSLTLQNRLVISQLIDGQWPAWENPAWFGASCCRGSSPSKRVQPIRFPLPEHCLALLDVLG